jgi:hypothetical protein
MAGYFDNKNSLMSDIELMPHRIIRSFFQTGENGEVRHFMGWSHDEK